MAMDILGTIRKDENECLAYISHLKFQTDLKHSQNVARKEGAIQKAFETARKAIKKGISFDVITDITGISKEEIEKLSTQ
jgi:MoaA/NifB/PqqE/SkfB family radical SAM enzyme